MIGNVLEWYDFGLYGYLAPLISARFFPAHDPIASLIAAYGGFAVGFAMRPVGGVILGHLGDRIGRQAVLLLSVTMMGLATTAIGLLPTYGEIGMWAPVLLLLVRLFQGLSVGGEFTGSVSYLIESAPMDRRGFAGSFANIGSTGGYLIAAGLAAVTVSAGAAYPASPWIWRVPFLCGGVIAALAFWLRTYLPQSAYAPESTQVPEDLPLVQAFRQSPRTMILVMLFTFGYGVANYLTMVFLATFASKFGHVGEDAALTVNTAAQAVALLAVPLAGMATDRLLRRRTMLLLAFVLFFIAGYGFFRLSSGASLAAFAVAQIGFGVILSLVMGSAPAMLAEAFPARYRISGYSVAFNFGIGFGGGTAPLIATALIDTTGNIMAPAWYLMLGSLLAAASLYAMHDRSREPLL